jgi:hypothetical protein
MQASSRISHMECGGLRACVWSILKVGARFRGVDMNGVVMRGVELVDVDINGEM